MSGLNGWLMFVFGFVVVWVEENICDEILKVFWCCEVYAIIGL